MTLTLFDFEVEVTPPVKLSDDEVRVAFSNLASYVKYKGNQTVCTNYVEQYIKKNNLDAYVSYFKEKKWLSSNNNIPLIFRSFHTVDEVIIAIQNYYDELFFEIETKGINEDMGWHDMTWRKVSELTPKNLAPTFDETKILMRQIYEVTDKLDKQLAILLGWSYLKSSEKAKGTKMQKFTDKPYKKHFYPYFKSKVLEITDFDEMKTFVKKNFFMGRWDWWSDKNYTLPPRPVFEKLSLNHLQIAALVEANESNVDEILKVVLDYCGGSGGFADVDHATCNFPPTFTWKDYEESLTIDDYMILIDDIERLRAIQNYSTSEMLSKLVD